MFDLKDLDALWLNVTNIILGAIVVACVLVVGVMVFRDVMARVRKRATVPLHRDDHAFVLSDLGITMADGGEKLDENILRRRDNDRLAEGDQSNIHRSNN